MKKLEQVIMRGMMEGGTATGRERPREIRKIGNQVYKVMIKKEAGTKLKEIGEVDLADLEEEGTCLEKNLQITNIRTNMKGPKVYLLEIRTEMQMGSQNTKLQRDHFQ